MNMREVSSLQRFWSAGFPAFIGGFRFPVQSSGRRPPGRRGPPRSLLTFGNGAKLAIWAPERRRSSSAPGAYRDQGAVYGTKPALEAACVVSIRSSAEFILSLSKGSRPTRPTLACWSHSKFCGTATFVFRANASQSTGGVDPLTGSRPVSGGGSSARACSRPCSATLHVRPAWPGRA